MKTKVSNLVNRVKEKRIALKAQVKCHAVRLQEVLADDTGASAIEIVGAAVMAIVLICILINAFTGIFTTTVIPGITDKIKGIFAMG